MVKKFKQKKNYISNFILEKFLHLPFDERQRAIAAYNNQDCNHTVNNNKEKNVLKSHDHQKIKKINQKIKKKKLKKNKYRRILEHQVSDIVSDFGKLQTEYSMIKESENFKNPVEVINTGFPKVTAMDTSKNSITNLMTKLKISSSVNAHEPLQNTDSNSVIEQHVEKKLRPIIIHGFNIGYIHGYGQFSAKRIETCVEYFVNKGHNDIVVFIPIDRKGSPRSKTQKILNKLNQKISISYIPSRKVEGVQMGCHHERIILDYAQKHGGIIVSNDNYKYLYNENEAFKDIILNRRIIVKFVNGEIIVPEDQYIKGYGIRSLSEMLHF